MNCVQSATLIEWKIHSKKKVTLIFHWTTFSCDYVTRSLWHRFDKLQQCHDIYFRPESHSLLQHIPKILSEVKVWTLWGPIHVWKRCLILPESLFHNLSLMNPGIVVLEYVRAIREEKNPHFSLLSFFFFCVPTLDFDWPFLFGSFFHQPAIICVAFCLITTVPPPIMSCICALSRTPTWFSCVGYVFLQRMQSPGVFLVSRKELKKE